MSLVLALLFGMLALWAISEADGGSLRLGGFMLLLASLHRGIVSFRLMDSEVPVIQAYSEGLRLHPMIASRRQIEWPDVKKVWVLDLFLPPYLPLPLKYLVIQTRSSGFFDQQSRLLPTSFFGTYFLPARLFHGGGKAARQFERFVKIQLEADREAARGELQESPFDRSLRWSILEKSILPMPKDGPDEEALVEATQQAMMREVGVHEDIMDEDWVAEIKSQPAVRKLEGLAGDWAREIAAEEGAAKREDRRKPVFGKAQPTPPANSKRSAMLNGRPVEL
ncbi:hypothetical protein [Qipengyuania sphaerica]|uniref:hypothetical protein n=1 Tax=Qipengyuania sphaerica TaxID=2867243 RepID=UPI001C87F55C|nr:hypothetical protein [Qipengyuania sphaerica]MBX7540395.1 hypothetical protein [Qipengyuania sphaerica]